MTGATEVRLELLRPREIAEALARNSLVYLPLGTIEWHCHHLPVGLDALTAHGVCVGAAQRGGGLVYPALYFGTGGDHGDYPWTVMLPGSSQLVDVLEFTLHRFDALGIERALLFTGHFADEQLAMIDAIAERWNASTRRLHVVATGINRSDDARLRPDHAGVFETTMLAALHPDRVALDELEPLSDAGPLVDKALPSRHDPSHPLWGVMGPDPRRFDAREAQGLLDRTVAWLAALAGGDR